MEARVVRISIAPVKALQVVDRDAVDLTPVGVAGDRRFWLADADGRLANGKRLPELMRVRPEWDETTRRLALLFPDGTVVAGVVEPGEPAVPLLRSEPHPSRRVPGPWQEALSDFAGVPLILWWSEAGAPDRGAGGGAVTIVSRASIERLRREMGAEGPVDGRRFRMLFEIDGVAEHEEDGWIGGRVRVGDAVVEPAGDVGRCAVTSRDPETAQRDLDTLGALAAYRPEGRAEPLPFGVYGAIVRPGRVRVGDPVELVGSVVPA